MFFIRPQLEFMEATLRPDFEGKKVELPEGYTEAYEIWKESEAQLNLLSPEERLGHFEQFLRETWLPHVLEKDATLEAFLKRDQVILASKDNGQTFDLVLTPENAESEAAKAEDTPLQLLNVSFVSSTLNLKDLFDQQMLIHAVRKLESEHFLVKEAEIKQGKIQIQAMHTRASYRVEVDLGGDVSKTLIYEFINLSDSKDRRKIVESELPENFRMENSTALKVEDVRKVSQMWQALSTGDQEQDAFNAVNAAGVTLAVNGAMGMQMNSRLQASQELNNQNQRREKNSALGEIQIQMLSNVQANARMAMHKKRWADSKTKEQDIKLAAQKDLEIKIQLKQKEEEQKRALRRKHKRRNSGSNLLKLGAGLGAGVIGGGMGLSYLVLNNTIILGS